MRAEVKTLWRFEDGWKGKGEGARLKGVSCEIKEGVTAVVGCSGAGKSSLLNVMVGFDKLDRGKVFCSEKCIGWVPQDGGLWRGMTVEGHVKAVLCQSGEVFCPGGAEDVVRVEKIGWDEVVRRWLVVFGLEGLEKRVVGRLSGGERARLSVVRALVMCSGVDGVGGTVVMDEPMVSVGRGDARRYWEVIRRWRVVTGGNVVFSTHFPELVIREADSIVCMDEGEVVFEGALEALYERPASERLGAFLGELNWFEVGEHEGVIGGVRPEQLMVEVAEDSGFGVVVGSERLGVIVETVVRLDHGAMKRLLHVGDVMKQGDRVEVNVMRRSRRTNRALDYCDDRK
ncbi:Sulfate/thiosulfate import ATP-binding protein CysA [Poriferisphaera corsica]|uniref:Sulfate/thiosulfate import ATP-binding protein CysA n=2 Tax=Poriferisphaera corsica TaxID=2528020 RepID=A0A517YQ77_9BACT|nr:Sulfate/thiosulfate import ATP-binding protein CysA [Poriferisphaera corsica]